MTDDPSQNEDVLSNVTVAVVGNCGTELVVRSLGRLNPAGASMSRSTQQLRNLSRTSYVTTR